MGVVGAENCSGALSLVVHGHLGHGRFARVAVGLAVTSADRVPDIGTVKGNRFAVSGCIRIAALQVAVFACIARDACDGAADFDTLPIVINVYTCCCGITIIGVGLAVATATSVASMICVRVPRRPNAPPR